MDQPTAGEALKRLEPLVGEWTLEAKPPDGRTALVTPDGEMVEVWDTEQGEPRQVLPTQQSPVAALTLTSDGRTAAIAHFDHYVRVWALEFAATSTVKPITSRFVSTTPDDRWAVASNERGEIVGIWELDAGCPVTGRADWEAATQAMRAVREARAACIDQALAVIKRHDGARAHSSFAEIEPIDHAIVVGDTNGVRALTYVHENAKTSEVEESGPSHPRYALTMWDLTAADSEPKTLIGHSSPIHAVAMTPDGRRAVSASRGRTIRVWDLHAGRELQTLRGHRGMVYHVQITSDGLQVVSASEDRTVRVWDLRTWRCVAVYTGDQPMGYCAVSGDGRVVVTSDVVGRTHLLRLESV